MQKFYRGYILDNETDMNYPYIFKGRKENIKNYVSKDNEVTIKEEISAIKYWLLSFRTVTAIIRPFETFRTL